MIIDTFQGASGNQNLTELITKTVKPLVNEAVAAIPQAPIGGVPFQQPPPSFGRGHLVRPQPCIFCHR